MQPDPKFRPVRPTAARAAETATAAALRIVEGEGRISIRVSADALHAIKLAAVTRRTTVKRLVLDAIRASGVDVPRDADE